jgi:hypothetical protein
MPTELEKANTARENIRGFLDTGLDPRILQRMIHEEQVARAEELEQALRPKVGLSIGQADLLALRDWMIRAANDSDMVAPDIAVTKVDEAIDAGEPARILFALVRLYRVIRRQIPHLPAKWQ